MVDWQWHIAIYSVQCTLYTVQCTLYIVQCTLYTHSLLCILTKVHTCSNTWDSLAIQEKVAMVIYIHTLNRFKVPCIPCMIRVYSRLACLLDRWSVICTTCIARRYMLIYVVVVIIIPCIEV